MSSSARKGRVLSLSLSGFWRSPPWCRSQRSLAPMTGGAGAAPGGAKSSSEIDSAGFMAEGEEGAHNPRTVVRADCAGCERRKQRTHLRWL